MVNTTSSADLPAFFCISTGIPLPSSLTLIELSAFISTSIQVQKPAKASSTELSTISYTKW